MLEIGRTIFRMLISIHVISKYQFLPVYYRLVGGELSDFVALGVSAMFVLTAFLGGMMHLKTKVNQALDDISESRLQHMLKIGTTPPTASA